jgi:putative mRNA 3-end processing factor
VDWTSLLAAIEASGAGEVWVTHGYTGTVVRWLTERGIEAKAVQTRFEGERDDEVIEAEVEVVEQ